MDSRVYQYSSYLFSDDKEDPTEVNENVIEAFSKLFISEISLNTTEKNE